MEMRERCALKEQFFGCGTLHDDGVVWRIRPDGWGLFPVLVLMLTGGVTVACGTYTAFGDMALGAFGMVFGAGFFCLGLFMARGWRQRIVFDLQREVCRNDGAGAAKSGWAPDGIPFSEIAAVQVLEKTVRFSGNHIRCCEMNLVKRDGSRLHLLDSMSRRRIERDAARLAGKLGLPLCIDVTPAEGGKSDWLPVVLAGGLLLAVGAMFLWFFTLSPILTAYASRAWVEVPGKVLSSELVRSRSTGRNASTTWRILIRYEYEYAGVRYEGDRFDLTRSEHSSNIGVQSMRQVVRAHPPGTPVSCYVNPENPQEALISRELSGSFWGIAWFPLSFVAFGMICVFAGLRRR